MHPLMLFQAESTPRYGDDEKAALGGNLVSQRAFLTAMITDHCIKHRSTLEIRFAASAEGAINSFIALHSNDLEANGSQASSTKLVARLLPGDYGWRLSNDLKPYSAGIRAPVHVARVVRTAQILDLPYVPPDPHGTTSQALVDALGLVPGAPIGGLAGSRLKRSFPDIEYGFHQFDEKRLCLPFLGSLTGWRAEMRVLFEQMLANRPAVISVGLRPLTEGEIDESRLIAAGWRRMLGPVLGTLANSGFADAASLSRTFDRFAMPAAYLVQASIKCAALSAESASGVASVLAACLGGSTGFEIRHPSRPALMRDLPTMAGDYPVPGQRAADLTGLLADQRDRLLGNDIALQPDDPALQFMARVNHIYTLDEIHSVVELPIADDNGLPGMITRPVPPFPTPWTHTDEAAHPVRIGMIKARYPDPLEGHDGGFKTEQRFHRLSLEALTKHALIVGSTGSGKTLTTLFLARELQRNKVPFLVIEPVKTEYFQKLSLFMEGQLTRWRFEGDPHGEPVADFLAFDPMTLQRGVSVARHVSYLKSCFLAAFPLPSSEGLMLESSLREYYTSTAADLGCGLKLFARGAAQTNVWREDPVFDGAGSVSVKDGVKRTTRILHPSMDGFFRYFKYKFLPRAVMGSGNLRPNPVVKRLDEMMTKVPESVAKEYREQLRRFLPKRGQSTPKMEELLIDWRQFFERRFDAIQAGPIGLAARGAAREFERTGVLTGFERMLESNAVIELDGIPDDEQKSLMMAFLLTALFERRQSDDLIERELPVDQRPPARRGARHVMIVEEAHRVLSASGPTRSSDDAGESANAKSVSLFVDMLAEIRAFGQGIVIVEQIPTKIVGDAIKNTNLKIMLRLTSRDDREYLGEAMNFTESQKRFVATLRAEHGKEINMVVFEEGIEQPMMLSLPFKPTSERWVFDELFNNQEA